MDADTVSECSSPVTIKEENPDSPMAEIKVESEVFLDRTGELESYFSGADPDPLENMATPSFEQNTEIQLEKIKCKSEDSSDGSEHEPLNFVGVEIKSENEDSVSDIYESETEVFDPNLTCNENPCHDSETNFPVETWPMNRQTTELGYESDNLAVTENSVTFDPSRFMPNKQKVYLCNMCPKQFKSSSGRRRHFSNHHKKLVSNAQSPTSSTGTADLKEPLPAQLSQLDCGETLSTSLYGDKSNEQVPVHAQFRFIWSDIQEPFSCGADFAKSQDVNHKPHLCSECGAQFRFSSGLKMHLPTHSDLKSFSCEQCPARFKRIYDLQSHMSTHKDVTPFLCQKCPARFKCKRYLMKHLTTHSEKKDFACDLCSLRLKSRNGLKLHLAVHADEKLFACTKCPMRFNTRYTLRTHLLVHKDDRPFVCDKCSASFKRRSNLNEHLLNHDRDKSICCPRCPKKFKTGTSLKAHLSKNICEKFNNKIRAKSDDVQTQS